MNLYKQLHPGAVLEYLKKKKKNPIEIKLTVLSS